MPRRLTTSQFIERAQKVHGNHYDYSRVEYTNNHTPVSIICSSHGRFLQQPNAHLDQKQGCPLCGRTKCDTNRKLTTKEFIARATALHGARYNYSKTSYHHNNTPVVITCLIHGDFTQTAYTHIKPKGSGCPRCAHRGVSKLALRWLADVAQETGLPIQHALNVGEYNVPGTRYKADGYCANTNTLYEFYGDCWHGNPAIYKPNDYCHPFERIKAKRLYARTIAREQTLKKLGYDVVVMWERDYLKQINRTKEGNLK